MNGTTTAREAGWGRWTWLALLIFGFVIVGLVLVAATGGVRGSDQYWYVADVTTLVRDHTLTTNTVFPVALLGPDPVLPPPFIHNVLSMYLAAVPAMAVGSYAGWLVLNVLATFAAAVLIYQVARTVTSRWAALTCAVLYPALPVVFWHTVQPLSEASTSLFAALAIYFLSIAGVRTGRWVALVGALGLLYLSRESYLPLLLAAPVWFFFVKVREPGVRARVALASSLLVATTAVVVVALADVAFAADNVRFSYTRLLHAAVPGSTSNMWFNFDLSPESLADRLPFDPGLVAGKLGEHLAEQFVRFDSPAFAVFYWTFNLLAIVAVVMLWRCRHRPRQRRLVIGALGFVAIHVTTIAIFQNQARYTMPAIPGLLVVLAIALDEIPFLERRLGRRPTAIVVALTIMAIVPLAAFALVSRRDGLDQARVEQATRVLLDSNIPSSEPLLIAYDGTPQVFAYAARPRLIAYLWPTYTDQEITRVRTAFPSHWLLAPAGSALIATLGPRAGSPSGEVDGVDGRWLLVHLGD